MLLLNPIGWCDETANMVIGCTKVSDECKLCYAHHDTPARVLRAGKWPGYPKPTETWGGAGIRVPVNSLADTATFLNRRFICDKCSNTVPAKSFAPGDTHPDCGGEIRRIRLFADSNSDWLDERWPPEVLARLLTILDQNRNVDFQLLSKRPECWKDRLLLAYPHIKDPHAEGMVESWLAAHESSMAGEAPSNVWIGTSVGTQKSADKWIPALSDIPARIRFLSCEPLLEDVDLKLRGYTIGFPQHITAAGHAVDVPHMIHWISAGGESGKGARPCMVRWLLNIADQGREFGIPVYLKQLGARPLLTPCGQHHFDWRHKTANHDRPDGKLFAEDGPHWRVLLRDKKGGDIAEWPNYPACRCRQFPPNRKPREQ